MHFLITLFLGVYLSYDSCILTLVFGHHNWVHPCHGVLKLVFWLWTFLCCQINNNMTKSLCPQTCNMMHNPIVNDRSKIGMSTYLIANFLCNLNQVTKDHLNRPAKRNKSQIWALERICEHKVATYHVHIWLWPSILLDSCQESRMKDKNHMEQAFRGVEAGSLCRNATFHWSCSCWGTSLAHKIATCRTPCGW